MIITHLHIIRWEENLKLTSKQSIWRLTAGYLAYIYIMSLILFLCPDRLHQWDPLWLLRCGLFQSSRVMWAVIFISLRSDFHFLNDQFEQVMLFLQHTGHRFQPEGKSRSNIVHTTPYGTSDKLNLRDSSVKIENSVIIYSHSYVIPNPQDLRFYAI